MDKSKVSPPTAKRAPGRRKGAVKSAPKAMVLAVVESRSGRHQVLTPSLQPKHFSADELDAAVLSLAQ